MKNKICPMCKIEKFIDDFYNDKSHKDGKDRICQDCSKQNTTRYQKNNPEKIKENSKKYKQKTKKEAPWKITLTDMKQRCNNSKNTRYDDYGGRGVKCLITEEEIKELWFRDKAWELIQASIDRIDNDRDYTYNNCRFIEMGENSAKDKRKIVLQYDLAGKFIKEFKSTQEATRFFGKKKSHIWAVCNTKRNQAFGFIWKYKEINNVK